jgi:hypothetical protein
MEKVADTAVGSEHIFEQDGKYYIRHRQNADSIQEVLSANEAARISGHDGYSKTRELRRIASIPVMLDYEFTKKYGADYHRDPVLLKRLLTEHSLFKTV